MRQFFLILLSLLFLSGCVSLNSVSLTPIPPERKNHVRTEKDKLIFLGFNFDNDFVDAAVDDLKQQCPNGKVTGLLTKDESILYFLFFVWKKRVTATGYCVPIGSVGLSKTKPRGTASENLNSSQTVPEEDSL